MLLPTSPLLLRDYMNLRKAERSDWSRYGQQKGTMDDLKAVSQAINYLREHQLFNSGRFGHRPARRERKEPEQSAS